MNAERAHYVRLVNSQRKLFARKAEPKVFKALEKQLEHIFKLGVLHPIGTEIDHLIHPEPLEAIFEAIYKDVATHFGKATQRSLTKKSLFRKDDEEDDFDASMEEAINDFIASTSGKMIKSITDATRQRVKDFIETNKDKGWNAAQLSRELKNNFTDFNKMRAMRIARTEVGRASNFAGDAASKLFDFEMVKTWLHAGISKDDRPSHEDANEQTVDNDDVFDLGDYTPSYPQDGSGGPDEEVNCNCVVFRTRKKD